MVKICFVILFITVYFSNNTTAQNTFTAADTVIGWQGKDISSGTFFLEDCTEKKLSFDQIKNSQFTTLLPLNNQSAKGSEFSLVITWLKFSIKNTSSKSKLLLDLGRQGEMELYNHNGVMLQKSGAYFYPYNAAQWKPLFIETDSGKATTFFVKVINKVRRGAAIKPVLHTEISLELYLLNFNKGNSSIILGMSIITGCLFVMGLFSIAQYIFRKENLFIYYAVFCIAGSMSMLWNTNYQFSIGLPLQMRSANQLFAYNIAFFYALFIKEIINLPVQFPLIWKLLRVILFVFLLQAAISIYEFFNGFIFVHNTYYQWSSSIIILMNMLLFVSLVFCKSQIKVFLIAGAGLLWLPNFIVFTGVLSAISNKAVASFAINFIFGVGIFLENFFFLLALGYRNYRVEKEKNELQLNYAQQLQNELGIKAKEIEQTQSVLEAERFRQIEYKLKQQITETEMAALKAQMNPHFIFNCISSIDGLIQANDKYNATVYLNKFAKLIRNVLDSSKENTVEFAKDIETLQLYIDLEKLRDESKYAIQLNVSQELLESDYQVPPLVIQPFVENAIHHGLRNRQDNYGKLTIDVESIEDHICYSIIDNGVGRTATAEQNRHNHQSYGVQMSTERIKLFNDEAVASAKIEDLYNGEQPAGTRVTVKLKIK